MGKVGYSESNINNTTISTTLRLVECLHVSDEIETSLCNNGQLMPMSNKINNDLVKTLSVAQFCKKILTEVLYSVQLSLFLSAKCKHEFLTYSKEI